MIDPIVDKDQASVEEEVETKQELTENELNHVTGGIGLAQQNIGSESQTSKQPPVAGESFIGGWPKK
jgi:bacteriocin-like protein